MTHSFQQGESFESHDTSDDCIEEWSKEKLNKRSKELQLIHSNCSSVVHRSDKSGSYQVEEILLSELDDDSKSATKSTTSDSQVN